MRKKQYIRDKRSPIPSSENVSKIMSQNKAKNTKPELQVRKALWNNGYRGYRIHPKNLPGKPDIVFSKDKIAIFVNGCYWHRCPQCNFNLPKSNTKFWKDKFANNVKRDKIKNEQLALFGYNVVIIWECQLKNKSEIEILDYVICCGLKL